MGKFSLLQVLIYDVLIKENGVGGGGIKQIYVYGKMKWDGEVFKKKKKKKANIIMWSWSKKHIFNYQ
jgi:hypothetical protein